MDLLEILAAIVGSIILIAAIGYAFYVVLTSPPNYL